MKVYYIIITFSIALVFGCKNNQEQQSRDKSEVNKSIKDEPIQKGSKFINDVTKKVEQLVLENNYTPFDVLQAQKLDRIEENSEVLIENINGVKKTGNEMYYHLKERTMLMGSSFLCKRCPNIHLNNASGFVIHEDGVIVTNYHVIEVNDNVDITGIFASDHEGNVYPVASILSASQSNDLAILKLDTKGKKLKFLPVAQEELIGEDVFMMGHPFSNTFFMSKGMIARRYISERADAPRMAITAEFGQGASGGPVVNEKGQVVGIVSATYMHYTNNSKEHGDLQMIIKESIPVSTLNNYVKRNDI